MLRKLQEEQREWSKKNFGDQENWEPLVGIYEELGELSHAHLKHFQKIRTNEDHIANAKDAVGDIVIYLSGYCNSRGFDLQDVVQDAWDSVKRRDWITYPKDGVSK